MSSPADPRDAIVNKLASRVKLEESDRKAIMALPFSIRTFEPPAYLIREGELSPRRCSFILSGFAFRQKLAATGLRQIVSLHLPGDFLDLQHLFLDRADHNVQALSRLEIANIEREALQELVLKHPRIGRAMWIDCLVDASIFREWVLNVGRRSSRARVAHILCEFAFKMNAAGMAKHGDGYELPMTQEQLGDAVGLTSVHINRTLKSLEQDGLIQRDRRFVRFASWEAIRDVGDFSALYLHPDQTSEGGF